MGSDIVMFLEFLLPNGEWVADKFHQLSDKEANRDQESGLPAVGRDYRLFAALASVRGKGRKPKGLPIDVSPHVKAFAAMGGKEMHDHSYCSIDLLERLAKRYKVDEKHPLYDNPFMEDESPLYVSICAYARKVVAGHEDMDARVVFWFDS